MTGLESNIFPITNLYELSSSYRLYKIRGLNREHEQYFQNRQLIARKLSYALKSPATVVEYDDQPFGQRSLARYSAQVCSSLKRCSNSIKVRG